MESLQKKEEDSPANVLIKYLVPPPVQEEFVEVFKGVKDGEHVQPVLRPVCMPVSSEPSLCSFVPVQQPSTRRATRTTTSLNQSLTMSGKVLSIYSY